MVTLLNHSRAGLEHRQPYPRRAKAAESDGLLRALKINSCLKYFSSFHDFFLY